MEQRGNKIYSTKDWKEGEQLLREEPLFQCCTLLLKKKKKYPPFFSLIPPDGITKWENDARLPITLLHLHGKEKLKCLSSLPMRVKPEISLSTSRQICQKYSISPYEWNRLVSVCNSNVFGICDDLGKAIYAFSSFLEHSENPNLKAIPCVDALYLYSKKDIKKGELLTISYKETWTPTQELHPQHVEMLSQILF